LAGATRREKEGKEGRKGEMCVMEYMEDYLHLTVRKGGKKRSTETKPARS
jgi:hypothetical protein